MRAIESKITRIKQELNKLGEVIKHNKKVQRQYLPGSYQYGVIDITINKQMELGLVYTTLIDELNILKNKKVQLSKIRPPRDSEYQSVDYEVAVLQNEITLLENKTNILYNDMLQYKNYYTH